MWAGQFPIFSGKTGPILSRVSRGNQKYLCYEPYVMTTEIYDKTGTVECVKMPAEFKYQRRMTGSLVGDPFFGKDESGREGTFFHFGNSPSAAWACIPSGSTCILNPKARDDARPNWRKSPARHSRATPLKNFRTYSQAPNL
ncbi:Velvet factor [Emericellopsis cladophorae]|uniref:Velvet factor n=1 Tax=Emericellopsis cladophorae TaxID=2686198 RepID=A0A9Q0BB68_9HYPO|nr:Velvet factor [Emericellopsis cladophorae]KAI6777739.1 Velvet factor [Emericellopsis cladophorae]